MGDMADYTTDQGELAFDLHEAGMCGEVGICQYCEEEYQARKKAAEAGGK